MFTPKVPKAQTKALENSSSKMPQRSTLLGHRLGHDPVERGLFLQRTIGNQATLRFLAQQTLRPAVRDPRGDSQQEVGPTENTMTGEASRGASWDFSKIPLFPPGWQGSSPRPSIIQRKLVVGQDNDQLEHEADRAADQVMRMPAPDVSTTAAPPQISRKCAACEEEQNLQKKPAGPQAAAGEAPASVHEVLRSPGQPLDAATRAYFEPRFKYDFSTVRVHADAQATESARQISSLAYTVGTNVVFRSDTYAPDTPAGKGLLAHEMAHIVQQRHATANGLLSLGRPGDLAEQEAELAANRVTAGQQVALLRATENAAQVVRRSPGPKKPTPPSPPEWLGPLRASATHLSGDLWEVRLTGLGLSPVGPHTQMKAYLRTFNQNRPPGVERMVSAHIIGGEHIGDLGWDMPYDEAPCVGVSQSLHDKWSGEINSHMGSKGMGGGRATKTTGRTIIGPDVVKAIHADVYKDLPELRGISLRIINLEAKRIMGAKYGMPKPTSPMDVHQGSPVPAPKSPMDVHQGGMPQRTSPMDVHQGGMPQRTSPMDVHQGGMPKSPVVAPPVRPTSAWKAGLKAGGTALGWALVFAGLGYLVNKKLEKDLEETIDKARHGAMGSARHLQRQDPSKPVYMMVKVRSGEDTRFVPLVGFLTEVKLDMISMGWVREEIDPPIVEVDDTRLTSIWHPHVWTIVTYTELLLPSLNEEKQAEAEKQAYEATMAEAAEKWKPAENADIDGLSFADGKVVTTDRLLSWAKQHYPRMFDDPRLVQNIMSSNELVGSQDARKRAVAALRKAAAIAALWATQVRHQTP